MVAVGQFQTGHPGTIGHLAHGVGIGPPTVEVAYQGDPRGTGRVAEEVDVFMLATGLPTRSWSLRLRWCAVYPFFRSFVVRYQTS